jgi:hypothetical protein
VKPMGRRLGTVTFGCISSRIAKRMAPMARSCSVSFLSSRVSSCAKRRANSRFELNISRNCTKSRTTWTLISTARGLFKIVAAMMALCSVRA